MLVLLLAAALAQPAPEPLRFSERTFGLGAHTWTVYEGRNYLTAPQFAAEVGDLAMVDRLTREKRRQSATALVLIGGGSAAMLMGPYVALIGAFTRDTRLGTTMMASGAVMSIGGAAAYYGAVSTLLFRAPRRNRIDLYYTRDEAEAWAQQRDTKTPESSGRLLLCPIVTRKFVGVAGRF